MWWRRKSTSTMLKLQLLEHQLESLKFTILNMFKKLSELCLNKINNERNLRWTKQEFGGWSSNRDWNSIQKHLMEMAPTPLRLCFPYWKVSLFYFIATFVMITQILFLIWSWSKWHLIVILSITCSIPSIHIRT